MDEETKRVSISADSAASLWDDMRKIPVRKQFELYAATRRVPVKAVIEYALRDWMESVGVGHIADAMASRADS